MIERGTRWIVGWRLGAGCVCVRWGKGRWERRMGTDGRVISCISKRGEYMELGWTEGVYRNDLSLAGWVGRERRMGMGMIVRCWVGI